MGGLGTGVGALLVEIRGCFAQSLVGRPLQVVLGQDDTSVRRRFAFDAGFGDAEICDVDSTGWYKSVNVWPSDS